VVGIKSYKNIKVFDKLRFLPYTSEQINCGECYKFHYGSHFFSMSSVCVKVSSVNSKYSISFEARELKFCIETSRINGKKIPTRFLKFCLRAKL